MSTHEGTLHPVADGGHFVACACGWTSDARDTPGAALTDYARHIKPKD